MSTEKREWTEAQLLAIKTIDSGVLVSAAAGSGKTSVLAERCVYLVCDAPKPCEIDQLLVVTFTEAAANEMRSRIAEALRNRIAGSSDERLQRQLALIDHANISTVHSFCRRLLKQNFQLLDIDPDFRVMDGADAALLRSETVSDLFSDCYERDDDGSFQRFIDSYGEGNDQRLMHQVTSAHAMLGSLIDPAGWMKHAVDQITEAADKPLEGSALGQAYIDQVRQKFIACDDECAAAIKAVSAMNEFPGYVDYLRGLGKILETWRRLLHEKGFDAMVRAVRETTFARLPTISNSVPGKEQAKSFVENIQTLCKSYWPTQVAFSAQQLRDGMRQVEPFARKFLELVNEFDEAYTRAKRQTAALDFTDLEKFALRLLCDDPGAAMIPSAIARLNHKRFQHVLVDEYQDINELQSRILSLVSRDCVAGSAHKSSRPSNLFCVGDVKQSIYRFRLAEPRQFRDREASFREKDAIGKVIDLQANFRSRERLIDAINSVFERLMSGRATEIDYDDSHRLHAKATYPPSTDSCFSGAPIELHLLPGKMNQDAGDDDVDDSTRTQREAALIARRIKQLMGNESHPRTNVYAKDVDGITRIRPLQYKDIVILLRSAQYAAENVVEALRENGVPSFTDRGVGYFDTMELRDMISLLRLLDNAQQDIPLATVLRSPLGGLPHPEDNLARIRLAFNDESTPFHCAASRYAREIDDELAACLRDFFAQIGRWREVAHRRPVAELVRHIFEETGFLAFCNGLQNGQQRVANLLKLYERAQQFSGFERQGLYRFIEFLDSLRDESAESQVSELNEAQDVVRIMTIHSAKGLEFPVVFLPDLAKRINTSDLTGDLLLDRRGGLGLSVIDERKQIRYPSLARMMVASKLKEQTLAEELRVLYVAMTRPREHLILVGSPRENAEESWAKRWAGHASFLPVDEVLKATSMLDWIGPVAAAIGDPQIISTCRHTEADVQSWNKPTDEHATTRENKKLIHLEPLSPAPVADALADQIIHRLTQPYAFESLRDKGASTSVTAWTKHQSPALPPSPGIPGEGRGEGSRQLVSEPELLTTSELPLPAFLVESRDLSATDRGTAVHLVLEHLDFSRPCTKPDVDDQIQSMLKRNLITRAQANAANFVTIEWLLNSELNRLLKAPKSLRREQAFNFALPPNVNISKLDALDQIMVRGRIDLLIETSEGWSVIDYKTDRVFGPDLEARADFYAPQVKLYRDAIERITHRKVISVYLVFLTARKIVAV